MQREERILILAPPRNNDAENISAAATEGGFTPEIVADMAQLCMAIGEGAGAVVLVDAAFSPADVAALRDTLYEQPPWSALPIMLIAADVEQDEVTERFFRLCELLQPTKNTLYLGERRLGKRLLINWLGSALDGRRRQYAARAVLERLDLEHRRLLAVLAALPVGVVVLDAAGRVIESNAASQRIWGGTMPVTQSAEDFRYFRAWRADDGRKTQAPFGPRFLRVIATGQPADEEELEIEAFDGVRRTMLSSVIPIRSAGGEIAGAVSIQVDITERARVQRARQILSEATAALIEPFDIDATLRTLSRIVVKHLADCCVIDEADEHGELCRLVAETGGARSTEEAARILAFAPTASGNSLAARVLRSGKPTLLSEVPEDWVETGLHADEHRAAFAAIGVYSLMVLPLINLIALYVLAFSDWPALPNKPKAIT